MHQLFSEFGTIIDAKVHYDSEGPSRGTVNVEFQRNVDAIKAMKQYHNVQLDGKPMRIEIVTASIDQSNLSVAKDKFNNRSWNRQGSKRKSNGHVGKFRYSQTERGGYRNGRGRSNQRASPMTAEQLDAQLDKYVSATKT